MKSRSESVAERRDREFEEAIDRGDIETVRRCLLLGARVDGRLTDGATPLWRAVQNGCRPLAEYLLSCGASTTALTRGKTPLHFAMGRADGAEMALLLLNAGAPPDAPGDGDLTPIDSLIQNRNWGLLAYIHRAPWFPQFERRILAAQLSDELLHSIDDGDAAGVSAALSRGADPNVPGVTGRTPLGRALGWIADSPGPQRAEIAWMLSEAGATVASHEEPLMRRLLEEGLLGAMLATRLKAKQAGPGAPAIIPEKE